MEGISKKAVKGQIWKRMGKNLKTCSVGKTFTIIIMNSFSFAYIKCNIKLQDIIFVKKQRSDTGNLRQKAEGITPEE